MRRRCGAGSCQPGAAARALRRRVARGLAARGGAQARVGPAHPSAAGRIGSRDPSPGGARRAHSSVWGDCRAAGGDRRPGGRCRDDLGPGRARRETRMRAAALRIALIGAALLAGCAHKATPPAEVTRDMVRERFESRRAGRAERAAGLEAQLLVWTRIGDDKLPGVEARLLLASPERARIRVASAFGTAADLVLLGDSAM